MSVRSWVIHDLSLVVGAGRRTYCCLMPGRLLVGDATDGSKWRKHFEEFSEEGSLVHRCDVPEEFKGALVGDVVRPASDALDEFLYGFDTEVASDYVI
ncbi:hypothetical protein EVAR_64476_1 [Eumeta japonica]|uniref:Uncharacterized protein n=1 Tax=Eumeta variegata TaxID=151549 RepID=A0A4C1ZFF6_EUMVA|nr:hypothetical protein EVAR_64476_1 [Eumeta japonica]